MDQQVGEHHCGRGLTGANMEEKRIQIGMMKIMPIFDIPAWDDIEKKFGSLDEALEKLQAKNGWQRAMISVATILCNRALELAGDEPLEEKKVARLLPPKYAHQARTACLWAIAEGSRVEHKSVEEESETVDLVLREIEKKPEPEA